MALEIIVEQCVGCGACINSCPYNALEMVESVAQVNENCTLCGACVSACSFDAILLRKEEVVQEDMASYQGVLVVAEQRFGKLQPVTFELLNKARELSDILGTPLSTALFIDTPGELPQQLFERGADKVHVVISPELKNFREEVYAEALEKLIRNIKPSIVLTGATAMGRAFIPRVAAKLGTGLTADCTNLAIDNESGNLIQTRPAFGGNIMAQILCQHHRPQMATVRHKVFAEAEIQPGRSGEFIEHSFVPDQQLTEFIQFIEDTSQTINIADADIIVSGGRGLKNAENFKLLEELATLLNGAVGASRAAVDSDWVPYSHQVGQTGKTVSPKIYIACGISGAIQHLAGMQSSDCIIAINKDKDAPIFQVADFGIVGDLFEVVPELIKKLKKKGS